MIISSIIIRSIKNNNSPILSVNAKVVSKIKRTHPHSHGSGVRRTHINYYYVIFELKNRNTVELSISGEEYNLLSENEFGELTFQGTRYISFEGNK